MIHDSSNTWVMLTGEYPPQSGGVSDYTRQIAKGLVRAGDRVIVFAPKCEATAPEEPGVEVVALPDRFGRRSRKIVDATLRTASHDYRVLVQYVPHAFGCRAMNLMFCLWLCLRHRKRLWVMFHEVAFPLGRKQKLRHNLLGLVHRLIAAILTWSARRIFVSIPAWENLLRRVSRSRKTMTWLPVPSNLRTDVADEQVVSLRDRLGISNQAQVVGHFGTYGTLYASELEKILLQLFERHPDLTFMLLGRTGSQFAKGLAARRAEIESHLIAPDELSDTEVTARLAACDVMIQPYPDGVSSRRTSVMASLALGRAIVTTHGPFSEQLWAETTSVRLAPVGDTRAIVEATEQVLANAEERQRLQKRAKEIYEQRFALSRIIATLRADDFEEQGRRAA